MNGWGAGENNDELLGEVIGVKATKAGALSISQHVARGGGCCWRRDPGIVSPRPAAQKDVIDISVTLTSAPDRQPFAHDAQIPSIPSMRTASR